eukprot:7006509-Alexandrium_andersonii.AAC.1
MGPGGEWRGGLAKERGGRTAALHCATEHDEGGGDGTGDGGVEANASVSAARTAFARASLRVPELSGPAQPRHSL